MGYTHYVTTVTTATTIAAFCYCRSRTVRSRRAVAAPAVAAAVAVPAVPNHSSSSTESSDSAFMRPLPCAHILVVYALLFVEQLRINKTAATTRRIRRLQSLQAPCISRRLTKTVRRRTNHVAHNAGRCFPNPQPASQ